MRLTARIPVFICLWFAAEAAAFALVAHAVGFLGALFLCFLTSLWGLAMLRRLGFSTAWRLRRAMISRSHEEAGLSREAMMEGALLGVGSVLLILPGFVSDFVGLALAAPSVRGWIGGRLRARGRSGGGPAFIDLDPREWSRIDASTQSALPKRKPRGRRSPGVEPAPPGAKPFGEAGSQS